MAKISHKKARGFLHAAADSILSADNQVLLDAHLAVCQECLEFANTLNNLESMLHRTSHERWDNQAPRLNMGAVTSPPWIKTMGNNFLGLTQDMGKFTIIFVLALGYFLIANLGNNQLPISGTKAPTTLPTPNELLFSAAPSPTPSSPPTLIGLTSQGCENIIYVIQVDDTLEGIALQFGISEEIIVEHNNLKREGLSPGMELLFPVCNQTPSRSPSTPSNTMTITPLIGTIFPTHRE